MSNLVRSHDFKDRAMRARRRPQSRILAVPLIVMSLAGCATEGGTTDERLGRMLVAPGKYSLYSCAQLAERGVTVSTRQTELEALIAKAGPGAGGSFVSAVAYRPEYLQVRGDMTELRNAATAKNCNLAQGMALSRAGDAMREREADEARAKARERARVAR